MRVERLSKRVWAVLDDEVNCGFVATGAGAVLFDTGPDRRYGDALASIVRRYTGEDPVFVINSHFHRRHCGGNPVFPDSTLLLHRKCFERLGLDRSAGAAVRDTTHVVFSRDAHVSLGDVTFELKSVGGHAPGSLVMLLRDEGIVFAGDLLFVGRIPSAAHADLKTWSTETAWLAGLSAHTWLPGHGVPGSAEDIELQRRYLQGLISSTTMLKRAGVVIEELLAGDRLPLLGAEPDCPCHRRNLERAFGQVA